MTDSPTPQEIAQVLEDAADLLLVQGVRRGSFGWEPGGDRCVWGALIDVARGHKSSAGFHAFHSLRRHLGCHPPDWNDATTDDFEVIDTLRHVAKDLRRDADPFAEARQLDQEARDIAAGYTS